MDHRFNASYFRLQDLVAESKLFLYKLRRNVICNCCSTFSIEASRSIMLKILSGFGGVSVMVGAFSAPIRGNALIFSAFAKHLDRFVLVHVWLIMRMDLIEFTMFAVLRLVLLVD